MVYELTGVICPSLFKGYNKLNNKEKLEWNNRGFSTFHAIVVAVGSMYLWLVSDLFLDPQDVLITNRSSTLSNTLLGIVHHGFSMYSIILSLLSGQAQMYILMVLFTERTTPFVNLRWYLDAAGLKNSKMYIYNGVALFFGWLASRIILFVFFFCHMFIHFDQLAHFVSKDTVDLFNMLIKPLLYLSVFYFFSNPRSSFANNYVVLLCLVYCVTGIAYALAILLELGPSQLCSVLFPVVLTLISTQLNASSFVKGLASFCYTKWALEAFVTANSERYATIS